VDRSQGATGITVDLLEERRMPRVAERRAGGREQLRTWWDTVRSRPTSFGTRIVVSDSGVILSPK
jgi:hypothetical protein